MRTETSWNDLQDALGAAKVLAEFANLQAEGVNDFRARNPDFAPAKWWNYRPSENQHKPSAQLQWQIVQNSVREVWLSEFKIDMMHLFLLLTMVFDPDDFDIDEPFLEPKREDFESDQGFAEAHRGWDEIATPQDRAVSLNPEIASTLSYPMHPSFMESPFDFPDEDLYHRALQWLFGNGWRAMTCNFCHRFFVGEHPKAKFCSFGVTVDENFNIAAKGSKTSCFWAYRKNAKHRWWIDHSEDINKQRRQNYQLEKKRSRRAKRKNIHQR